jgi:HPr kinase/phosphorylase
MTEISSPARVHGSLVEVAGVGLLLLGKSGIGKSECTLELVMRGNRLVADDVVLIEADENGEPVGRSHDLVRHYIELRGIGIVHVPSLFGETSVAESSRIDLVVHLEAWDESDVERIGLDALTEKVDRFEIAALRLPVAPGRNMALLLEVAARNHRLKSAGHSGVAELDDRVHALLRRGRQ